MKLKIESQDSQKAMYNACVLHVLSLIMTHVGQNMLLELAPKLGCVDSYNLYSYQLMY